MALLDQVTQGMQKLGAPEEQAGAATDQTQAASRLASGLTGKATSGAGPQMSNLQEQVAQNQARIASQAEAESQQVQAEQLSTAAEQQAEEQKLSEEDIDEERLSRVDQYNQKATALLNDFTREGRKLDFRKDGAKIEQLGHVLRMADDKYKDQLEQVGARKRLDDQAAFDAEIMDMTFADERDLKTSNISFRRMMDADDRQFEKYLQELSIDDGFEIANAQAEAENSRQYWSGLGNLATAGVSGVVTAEEKGLFKPKPATPAPTAPASTTSTSYQGAPLTSGGTGGKNAVGHSYGLPKQEEQDYYGI